MLLALEAEAGQDRGEGRRGHQSGRALSKRVAGQHSRNNWPSAAASSVWSARRAVACTRRPRHRGELSWLRALAWEALSAPISMPDSAVRHVNVEITKALNVPEVRQKLESPSQTSRAAVPRT